MRATVLLSAGRHPVSGRASPVAVEMQAIRLAIDLGATPSGLHAGEAASAAQDALGHGLSRLVLLEGATDDPLPALLDHLRRLPPDLLLAGRRGQGGSDSGLLPYQLAHGLGWPIVADVVRLTRSGGKLIAEQALPRGARRVVTLSLPCIVTVHPAALPALPFRLAGLQGEVRSVPVAPTPATSQPELRPYRMRPKVVERSAGGGSVLVGVSAEQAASAILSELRRLKMLAG